MGRTTRGKVFSDGAQKQTYLDEANTRGAAMRAASSLTQEELDDLRVKWNALSKDERRQSRLLDPIYVKTPEGVLNLRTCEIETP